MRLSWLSALLLGGALLLSITACDDSSTVGLGVGPDSLRGGEPVTLDAVPTLDTATVAPQTGLELRPGLGTGRDTWRFLAGRVEDPVGGTIEADGYFDLLGRSILSAPLLDADVDSLEAEIRLLTTYLHGDTASTVDLRVLELAEDADMHGARADTTFPAGPELTSTTITPTDSVVVIDLPQSWVADNIESLRDTTDGGANFEENFHGFRLVAGDQANAVVGFSSTSIALRLRHSGRGTTADYIGYKTFTHVDQRNVPPAPQNYIVLQDGIGLGLTMNWDFDANPLDSLKSSPLNRADIFVPVDTTALQSRESSPTFARPLAKGFRIVATRAEGPETPSCASLGTVALSENQARCAIPLVGGAAPGVARATNDASFRIFNSSLLNTPVFTRYRVQVADRQSTSIGPNSTIQPGLPSTLPVLVPRPGVQDLDQPRATLTVTPL